MISVIIPVYNEEKFISNAIDSILNQDIKYYSYEILIADGMSNDNTREIIKRFQRKNKNIFLVDNPHKIVSIGFNKALSIAKGNIIIRLDGHAKFNPDYFRKCLNILKNKDFSCVGGIILNHSVGFVGESIKIAQTSNFGVGGVAFRKKKSNSKPRFVDTLAFGAYRKEVFELYGGYDEELIKNQDDEFNFRLLQNGNKIWLDPSLKTIYFSRNSFKKLFIQYFFYGFYKIRVFQKRRGFSSWRHIVPGLFVLGLIISIFQKIFLKNSIILIVVFFPYITLCIFSTLYELFNRFGLKSMFKKIKLIFYIPLAFITMHISYGSGFLSGIFYFMNCWNKNELKDEHYKPIINNEND